MQHINVENEFIQNLFESDSWGRFGVNVEKVEAKPTISESVETEEVEEVEQVHEDHESELACPLCESALDEPISEERISEHIDRVMTLVSESLNEANEDVEEETSEDEN